MSHTIPSFSELSSLSTVVSIPLETSFRGLDYREVMLIDGFASPGEWAAFNEYDDREAAWWLATALEQAFLRSSPQDSPPIPVNSIVPVLPASRVPEWLDRFGTCPSVKVKVGEPGQSLRDDIARVQAVRACVGELVGIRLDANGAWDVTMAEEALRELSRFDLDYVEQPVATVEMMKTLKSRISDLPVRLAADELVRKTHQVHHLSKEVCDVVIIKPSPLGGLQESRALAFSALEAGFDVTVSSGLETSVGLSTAATLAAEINATTGKATPHGLSTGLLLHSDVVVTPLIPIKGHVHARPSVLDREKMNTVLAPDDRQAWWAQRLERCYPLALEILAYSPE
jgi:O-succinylbenzoate synthase